MFPQDYFVGAVAIAIGLFAVAGAVMNRDWYFQLRKARWIEGWGGRAAARVVYAVLGITLIGLGIAIAMGFGPNKSSSSRRQEPRQGASGIGAAQGQSSAWRLF